ncbi:dihydropteroate synthase [Myxococcota bacterium]|nr:dihydropteroate synthase [Myxococcota bacterium]
MDRTGQIVGIVNITRDSFSDGGRYLDPERAIEHARALVAAGADVVELGPASSNPDARPVPAEEQIARLRPVLDTLASQDPASPTSPEPIPICVDATAPEVLRFALSAGVAWLNDVRGFPDERLYAELAASAAKLVVVHSLGSGERAGREQATPVAVLDSIERFFSERLAALVRAGMREERLIVDPGMGFFLGRDPKASLAVLARIPDLRARFGRPLLVSVSRKSFLCTLTGSGLDAIGAATLAAELHALRAGADYVRTHDVRALRDGLCVERAIADGCGDDLAAGRN